jgi:hypothetical protein
VERDDLAGTTTLVSEFGGGHQFPERAGLVFVADERFRITAHDDWAHAGAEGSAAYRVAWPGGPTVTADGRLEVTSDAEAFSVTARLTERRRLRRTWEEHRDLV